MQITLPPAGRANDGEYVTVKKIDGSTNAVTLTAIDGGQLAITSPWRSIDGVFLGTAWYAV